MISPVFAPSIGGAETVGRLLGLAWQRAGHGVTVTSRTPGPETVDGLKVVRRPDRTTLRQLGRDHDLVFHNPFSLPARLILRGRPQVAVFHTWIGRGGGGHPLQVAAKRMGLRFVRRVAVSRALAAHLPDPVTVIPNPFDASLFEHPVAGERPGDLLFLGRLVSDKGADRLPAILRILSRERPDTRLTVTGDGPERSALETAFRAQGLADQVTFTGILSGAPLAQALASHKVLLVPSRWEEPFGLVVLEAQAAGCLPVVSPRGGLPEAVGTCGRIAQTDTADDLAAMALPVLRDDSLRETLLAERKEHLARHDPDRVAARYLALFKSAGKGGGP
ncbi:MAG: glycosyltransferase family 4 protein [Opitutales bacterium]